MKNSRIDLKKYGELRLSTVAGAWVFYFLVALLPLIFLLITAFAVFGVNIKAELTANVPVEFKDAVVAVIEAAENATSGFTVFFIVTVFISGSALFYQMRKDSAYIYGVKTTGGGILKRISAVIALGVLFAAFIGAAFLFSFEKLLFSEIFSGGNSVVLKIGVFGAVIVACFFLNVMLNAFVSPVKIPFSAAAAGSAASISMIVAGTIGFIVYLRLFNPYNPFYGSLAAALVFLFWTYILMFGLSCGVAVSKRAYYKTGKTRTVKSATASSALRA